MRPLTLKIPAGDAVDVGVVGNYVRLKSATVPITIEAPDNNEKADFEQGDDAILTPFKRLRVQHADAAEQTITLYVGNGTRQNSSRVGGTLIVTPSQSSAGSQAAATVGVASGQLLAANSARKCLIVQNIGSGGVVAINVFGGAATLADGFRLGPGESIKFDALWCPTAQINAIADAAATPVVVMEGT